MNLWNSYFHKLIQSRFQARFITPSGLLRWHCVQNYTGFRNLVLLVTVSEIAENFQIPNTRSSHVSGPSHTHYCLTTVASLSRIEQGLVTSLYWGTTSTYACTLYFIHVSGFYAPRFHVSLIYHMAIQLRLLIGSRFQDAKLKYSIILSSSKDKTDKVCSNPSSARNSFESG